MDHFQVPSIPRVANKSLIVPVSPVVKQQHQLQNGGYSGRKEIVTTTNVIGKQQNTKNESNNLKTTENSLLPKKLLPKLCPSCSKILVDYLAPIEAYIKHLIHFASSNEVDNLFDSSTLYSYQAQDNNSVKVNPITTGSVQENVQYNETSKTSFITSTQAPTSTDTSTSNWQNQSDSQQSYQAPSNTEQHSNESRPDQNVYVHQQSPPQQHQDNPASHAQHIESSSNNSKENQPWQAAAQHHEPQHYHHSTENVTKQHSTDNQNNQGNQNRSHETGNQFTSNIQQAHQESGNVSSVSHHQTYQHSSVESKNEFKSTSNSDNFYVEPQQSYEHQQHTTTGNIQSSETESSEYFGRNESNVEIVDSSQQYIDCPESSSPFAYVTLAYNNLSAVNAIILANSIQLFNNKILTILDDSQSYGKKITTQYHIPTVILLCESIHSELRSIIYQVFDKVIETNKKQYSLLNDESLGIQQYKIQIWKELIQFKKCIYLESSTLVVGQLSNLFSESELSACVDPFLSDSFNCSVFVFEPNLQTFKDLLAYGLELTLNEDELMDEFTMINQFFASKWNKLSFIYNFVQNPLTYTMMPAFFKYGQNVRVVNFGSDGGQRSGSPFPWDYKFNINKTQLDDEPFKDAPVNNFFKFYLRLFIRRVWPLISKVITPLLLEQQNGRFEWSIFELLQILNRGSGDAYLFQQYQNPVTLRRKKSQIMVDHPFNFDRQEKEREITPPPAPTTSNVPDDSSSQPSGEKLAESEEKPPVIVQDEEVVETASTSSEQVEEQVVLPEKIIQQPKPSRKQLDATSRRQWEDGQADWLGEHQSDKIINRLKSKIKNKSSN